MFCLLLAIAPIKMEISAIESTLEASPTADLHYRLAQAHLKDQNPERAFLAFLEALDLVEPQESWELPETFLEAYLKGEAVGKECPILHSISLANQGDLAGFFATFMQDYSHYKDSFLDFKTRATIYLRLSQKTLQKEHYLERARYYLQCALELEPRDGSIYHTLFALSEDYSALLERLAAHDVYILRKDILPFVRAALKMNRKEIAEVIVEKGKQLYSYSRSIEAAEKLLGSE